MTTFVQTLRSGLIWVFLLVVLPGLLYAMASDSEKDAKGDEWAQDHPVTCGVCRFHQGTHLPSVIDGNNVYVLSHGQPLKHSIN
jgi:hypothetical protein